VPSNSPVSGPKVEPCSQSNTRLNTVPASDGTARFARTAQKPTVYIAPRKIQAGNATPSATVLALPKWRPPLNRFVSRVAWHTRIQKQNYLRTSPAVGPYGQSVQCRLNRGSVFSRRLSLRARFYFRTTGWTVRVRHLQASVCRRFLCFVSLSPLDKEMKCRHAQWLIVLSRKLQHRTRGSSSRTAPEPQAPAPPPPPPISHLFGRYFLATLQT
jgi:hypothetical protein